MYVLSSLSVRQEEKWSAKSEEDRPWERREDLAWLMKRLQREEAQDK